LNLQSSKSGLLLFSLVGRSSIYSVPHFLVLHFQSTRRDIQVLILITGLCLNRRQRRHSTLVSCYINGGHSMAIKQQAYNRTSYEMWA